MYKLILSILFFLVSITTNTTILSKPLLLDDIAGVYKIRFTNALISGEKYQSENILEIVPINSHAAYVRMKLQFANGHSGGIFSIAVFNGASLVYHNHLNDCLIYYVILKDRIRTQVDYNKHPRCAFYHGARGTLNDLEFPFNAKRTIRYLGRLQQSKEFHSAMQEYQKNQK